MCGLRIRLGNSSTGPAASANNCTWQQRSMAMKRKAAASTVEATVSSPWLSRMAERLLPMVSAMRRPSFHEHDDTALEQRVILVEQAGFLVDRRQQARPCGEGAAIRGVRMRRGNHVRVGAMNAAMDCRRRRVHRAGAVIDIGVLVDADQIVGMDGGEMLRVGFTQNRSWNSGRAR